MAPRYPARSVASCPKSTSSFPAPSSSSSTLPTSRRCSAATSRGSRPTTPASSARAATASTRSRPTPAAAPSARTSPTRTTASGSTAYVDQLDADTWQFRPDRSKVRKSDWIEHDEEGEREDPHRRGRRPERLHLPQPPRLPPRRRLRPARPGPPAGPRAARDQARRLLAAADPAYLPQRRAAGRHGVHRGHDQRVRPARLGPGRPRPRLVLLRQHRGARRGRAALRHQRGRADRADGQPGVRRAGAPLRGAPAVAVGAGASIRRTRGRSLDVKRT